MYIFTVARRGYAEAGSAKFDRKKAHMNIGTIGKFIFIYRVGARG
jgi:hypothetical protein